jgi:hypothetical protein
VQLAYVPSPRTRMVIDARLSARLKDDEDDAPPAPPEVVAATTYPPSGFDPPGGAPAGSDRIMS